MSGTISRPPETASEPSCQRQSGRQGQGLAKPRTGGQKSFCISTTMRAGLKAMLMRRGREETGKKQGRKKYGCWRE